VTRAVGWHVPNKDLDIIKDPQQPADPSGDRVKGSGMLLAVSELLIAAGQAKSRIRPLRKTELRPRLVVCVAWLTADDDVGKRVDGMTMGDQRQSRRSGQCGKRRGR